jgi:DNA-binding LytR/AlgR family response regulator
MSIVLRFGIGSVLFVAALIAYCELGSVLRGLPPAGLQSSAPWALQVAIPWIIIGAAVGGLSSRLSANRAALIRTALWIGAAVFGIAALALLGETLLRAVSGVPDLFAFICERAPASIAVSSLLVAIYVGSRSQQRERQPPTPDAGEWLEVMTGTGRTTIRLEQIECLQADRNYLNVVHSSGRTYLLRKTMTAAESLLDHARFMRIHRSTIVNCDMIKERRPGGLLVLRSGRTVTIGRAFRQQVAQRLAHLSMSG